MSTNPGGRPGRALVTGGAGFVGAHLSARLLGTGCHVTVADLWPLSARTPLRALGLADAVRYVRADVRDDAELARRAGDGYDVVFHLAGQPISPLSSAAPEETMSLNVGGTAGVARFVWRGGAEVMVLSSSACAYGVPDPADCPLRENSPLRAGHYVYTASKQQAERVVREAGIRAGIARCVNLYGPADWHGSRIVPRLLRQLAGGEPLELSRSSGDSILDFLYVGDAVEGLAALGSRMLVDADLSFAAPVFNFGAEEPVRVGTFAEALSLAFDGNARSVRASAAPEEPPMSKYLCSDRAARELGWRARTPRDAALRETVRWYQDHAYALEPLDDLSIPAPALDSAWEGAGERTFELVPA